MSLSQRFARAYSALFGSVPATLATNPERPIGSPGTRTRDTLGRKRKRGNGRIQPPSIDKSRFLRKDIEDAEDEANSGNLRHLAQIGEWVRADLTVGGLLANRCSVPRLPRIWRGNEEAREWLEGSGKVPGVFDAIFPPGELEELGIDHLVDGVGVGVFIRPKRCKYVKLVRLDPQWLQFRISENRWVYQGYNRLYDVEPGNGTWFLHTNGEVDPWRRGIGADLGRDQCSEDTAGMHRDAFIAKYGNPFVVASAPQAASDTQKFTFWRSLLTWTMGFAGVTPGHKVELLQPKAEGREVFSDAEQKAERRAMMRIAGQIVTSTGTVGFVNAEIFAQIASHLVARTGQDLATSLNEQCVGQIISMGIEDGWIEDDSPLLLGYDTTPPQARKAEAEAIEAAMKAFVSQWEAADKAGDPSMRPSVEEYRARFRLPVATDQLAAANAAIRTLTAEQRAQLFAQMRAENDNSEALAINGAPAITDVDPKETLNGAQIDSAVSIVSMVVGGQLPRDAGIAQLEILLNLTNAQATRMMGSAGAGFVAAEDGKPTNQAAAQLPPTPPTGPTQETAKDPDEPEEPGYSEKLAASMTERGLSSCPHGQEKYCPSCRVVRRYEVQDDNSYKPIWHSYAKAAA